jgi:hypothetical protein
MQVHSLVLYNHAGETRILPFKLGQVNIITGESETGKSSIINILDYCTGRSKFTMFEAEGVNVGVVAWYAVILQMGETQVFIAKPPPKGNMDSQRQAHFEKGTVITLPTIKQLKLTTNDDAIDAELSNLLGIAPNKALSPSGKGQDPAQASMQHTKFFLFQNQNLVSNLEQLFWRQNDGAVSRHIRDSLFFFLGADQDERWAKEKTIEHYKKGLLKLENRNRMLELRQAGQNQGMRTLLLQAQQAGLVAGDVPDEQLLSTLRGLMAWQPVAGEGPSVALTNSPLEQIRQQAQNLNRDFRDKLREIEEAEEYRRQAEGFSSAIGQHVDRLQAVHVFNQETAHAEQCPVCDSRLETPTPSVAALTTSLTRMQANMTGVQRERPQLEQYMTQLRNQLEGIREARRTSEDQLSLLRREQADGARLHDLELRAARAVGRIEAYLDSLELADDNSELKQRIEKGRKLIEDLEADLGSEDVIDIVESSLSIITGYMSAWADDLKMRYAGLPHRLDYRRLTVVASQGRGIAMDKMGGGSNALGCHLLSLVALHRFFIKYNRPVPGLIVFDQPSQVYFPSEDSYKAYRTGLDGTIKDVRTAGGDEAAVQRLFAYLFLRVKELTPNLQVIVTEHANLNTPEYQQALVEEPWVAGRGLIPAEWLDAWRQKAAEETE